MNPYARFLDSQDPLTVIAATSAKLRAAVDKHQAAIDHPRSEGKWSPRQIIAHLADTEIAFAMRLRQTVAEPHHVIQPFDQDAWAAGNPKADVVTALAMFTALRASNIEFIRAQAASMLAKPVTHPERGAMTFGVIIETMAGHDLNHLSQF
jgi:hypothetical protein